MLVLTVISYNGSPTDPLSASFDERGGAVGRADNNHMVLPDSERTVSRKHAQVTFRNGGYLIVDHGSNPIAVNGRELGLGREQAIAPGDTVQIGGYLLSVSVPQPVRAGAAPGDPFADLFGDSMATQVRPPTPARATLAPPPSAPPLAPPAARGHAVIPDDWNPFGDAPPSPAGFDPFPARPASPAFPAAAPLATPQLVHGSQDSLENLFDLGNTPARDPLGASPLAQPAAQPNTAGDLDPLRALQRSGAPSRSPIPDDFPDLQMPWEERVQAPAPQPAPAGAVLSWEQTVQGVALQPAAAPVIAAPRPPPAPAPLAAPPARPPQAAAASPSAAGDPADAAALLAAFLEGLDVPALRIDALSPSLMFRIGALLRESTRGTVELLAARAALKREVRAEVTMIAARENNPLKFSPTVEIALQHILGPLEKGFTPPIAAMQDAFDDLRAHQIGMLAGMRAALDGVLARFDPAQLETQLVPRTGLAGLLPANRQARLWASFESLHTQLAREAEDAFHELFGSAFLEAYEAHIDQVKRNVPQK